MRFVALGRTEFLLDTVERLVSEGHELSAVFTAPAEPNYLASVSDFASLAARHGVPFSDAGVLTTFDFDMLSETATQVGISVNWPRRLKSTELNALPQGIFNGHAGDLPRYRGNACLNWAILNGEPTVAAVVHQMVEERIDAGPILARRRRPVTSTTYIAELLGWLRESIPDMFTEVMAMIDAGSPLAPLEPHPGLELRCYPRVPSDSEINWRDEASQILAVVRASSRPFSGAFTRIGDGRLTIWRAAPVDSEVWGEVCAVPGQILRGPDGKVGVATGSSPIVLEDFDSQDRDINEMLRTRRGRLVQA